MTNASARSAGPVFGRAWRVARRPGAIGALIVVYLCLVGIVPVFAARPLIQGLISLGQGVLVMTAAGIGVMAARDVAQDPRAAALAGLLGGAIAGGALAVLVVIGALIPLRTVLLNASDELYEVLTLGIGRPGDWLAASWVPLVAIAAISGLAGWVVALPARIRGAVGRGLVGVVILGLFASLIRTPMVNAGWPLADVARLLFSQDGLQPVGAIGALIALISAPWVGRRFGLRQRYQELPAAGRRTVSRTATGLLLVGILVLPQALGPFFAQVVALVALYVLMGFGLNITLGLAGLLDLGFVAFFAVGAYTVGLLTSTAEFGIAGMSFWMAVPFAVLLAMATGALLGLPILSIRGDYLAIATLGFGEIIGIMARSDVLKPWLGGPQGVLNIPNPIEVAPDHFLAGPNQIYYIALAGAVLIAFISIRLRGSRLGRAWVAIREDEDVAEALGISLTQTKLLAYMLGAAFAGLGGAVFAGLINAVFPSSINLFVSINVAALIIVGGMGSIPGVVVGAIFLIGVPELFREFSDYRFLFYGLALIGMMIYRPEGLLPSRIVRRELHDDAAESTVVGDAAASPLGR